jgi:AraC-like DNA-binding protein/ligand-binding sensor protein
LGVFCSFLFNRFYSERGKKMSSKYIQAAKLQEVLQPTVSNQTGIPAGNTAGRETEPLLVKALNVLGVYDEAMNISSMVLDRSGKVVKTAEYKKQMRFCELCKKYFHNPTPGLVRTGIWEGSIYPCEKLHSEASVKSRSSGETHIYACAAGFAYWNSPIFRTGRYAGALSAGQVLVCGHDEAVEKFHALCNDRIAAEKFDRMLKDVAEKKHQEIQAMARMLGLCASEISEKEKDLGKTIRRMAWLKELPKGIKEPGKAKTTAASSVQEKAGTEEILEKERMLLAAFQRGDNETGTRTINELMSGILSRYPNDFELVRFRAIELLVLLSRAADSPVPPEISNRFLTQIQESKTTEELTKNLNRAAGQMADKIFSFRGMRHSSVLRKAQRFIWENYSRKINLEEISKASGLSAPYFSTIFNEEMGEKLSRYLNRLRVEKAATLLTETNKPMNQIAELCGFEDQSWFSKVFKSFTGVNPGRYREAGTCRRT